VARAKRTARADARRRHRQDQGIHDESLDPTSEPAEPAANRPSATSDPAPGQRLGIAESFRRSFRPLDIRADLAALPSLIRHRAFYLPALLTIASTGVVVATGGSDVVSAFLYAYFIQTPAIGAVFIAGFMAPRASWLLGVVIGLLSAVCYTFIIQSGIAGSTSGGAAATDVVAAAFLLSPVMGALFASAAAWYRRFLQLSNPNRGRSRQRPAARSTGDGRTRSGGPKAPARR
jgi:hypothetical protein